MREAVCKTIEALSTAFSGAGALDSGAPPPSPPATPEEDSHETHAAEIGERQDRSSMPTRSQAPAEVLSSALFDEEHSVRLTAGRALKVSDPLVVPIHPFGITE